VWAVKVAGELESGLQKLECVFSNSSYFIFMGFNIGQVEKTEKGSALSHSAPLFFSLAFNTFRLLRPHARSQPTLRWERYPMPQMEL
jgi:hypothetical protein